MKSFRGIPRKDHPLRVEIKDDKLIISIGIRTLAFAQNVQLEDRDDLTGDYQLRYQVVNIGQFAKDVVQAMEAEGYSDASNLERWIDEMGIYAIEEGSDAVEILKSKERR